jgi:hypothetical protein
MKRANLLRGQIIKFRKKKTLGELKIRVRLPDLNLPSKTMRWGETMTALILENKRGDLTVVKPYNNGTDITSSDSDKSELSLPMQKNASNLSPEDRKFWKLSAGERKFTILRAVRRLNSLFEVGGDPVWSKPVAKELEFPCI